NKGTFCLKKLRFSVEETNFIFDAMQHLKNNGFENVLSVVKQKDGDKFLDYKGEKYFLTEWIDGRECDYQNPMDLKDAVETMANLHLASKGFEPKIYVERRDCFGKWPENFQRRTGEMSALKQNVQEKESKNEIDHLYLQYVDDCIADANEALSLLRNTNYQQVVDNARSEKRFIHHDFAHHNILHTFDGKTYIVDFDFCIMDIRIHDLGSILLRNMKKFNWDIEKAFYIIECYENISPLSRDERQILIPFLLFPQDFWQISRQYYIEKKGWDECDFLDKMNTKSEDTRLKRQFIEEFMQTI
ncbi:MAG TPA: CotS family spore coat protein, partial [Prolixibacteraceae bacterium]